MMSMASLDLDIKCMVFLFTDIGCVIRSIVNCSREKYFLVLLEGAHSFVLLLIKFDPDPLNIF